MKRFAYLSFRTHDERKLPWPCTGVYGGLPKLVAHAPTRVYRRVVIISDSANTIERNDND